MNSTDIKTGDVLLFSNNTPTGFLLRTFTSSQWNHSGIAIRLIKREDPTQPFPWNHWTISLTSEGELFVLETNTGAREDRVYQRHVVGAGFSSGDWVFRKYNNILHRALRDCFRTPALIKAIQKFCEGNYGNRFPSSSLPFLAVWLGVSLPKDESRKEMFCSELMANFYREVIGVQYTTLTHQAYDGSLTALFGSKAPPTADLYNPGHYTVEATPDACIFVNEQQLLTVNGADLLYVILQPLLIGLTVMIIIYMSLPQEIHDRSNSMGGNPRGA